MPRRLEPTEVLQNAFAALARRDWQSLADFIDPRALDSLRQESLGLTILMAEQVQAGKDPSGGYNPRDVVIADHLAKVGTLRVPGFPNNPTVTELVALSPRDFFVRWCEAAYGSDTEEDPVAEVPALYRRILGSVAEDSSLAQVLYRREARGVDMGKLHVSLPGRLAVMPTRLINDKWRLSLNDDLGRSFRFEPFPRRDFPLKHPALPPRIVPPAPNPPSSERVSVRPDPAEVVRAAFSAFDRADWLTLAGTVDEDQLRTFRDQQIAYLAAWPSMRAASAKAKSNGFSASVFVYDDSLPPDAIRQVADLKIPGFPSSLPLGKLAELSPAHFFETWCEVAYGRKSMGMKTNVRRRVLGQIFESDTSAHVLYRAHGWYAVEVMSLKWSHDRWKILFNDDIGWIGDLDLALDAE
jgi:hypothetical protein